MITSHTRTHSHDQNMFQHLHPPPTQTYNRPAKQVNTNTIQTLYAEIIISTGNKSSHSQQPRTNFPFVDIQTTWLTIPYLGR